ncbi:hypothetical protein K7X08_027905 [Anisodus acutangulus]|uniref:Glucan endo-1,3-beta-D-glucosidase n=1 Tax=Anisodus acutangulus TaxID=402998 RepID=A0A9Q1MTT9_9SOLA|nr:hypothetical protein K7X08_027905 [Anisodus acutangulus]
MESGFTAEDLSTIGGIATVSLLHSFIPTHWLPFSIVGRAQKWTLSRTLLVTAFGAVLHVISTSILGITAITITNTIAGRSQSFAQSTDGENGCSRARPCSCIVSLCNHSPCVSCGWKLIVHDGSCHHSSVIQHHNCDDFTGGSIILRCKSTQVPLGSIAIYAMTGTYGINYGKISDNIPSPENVLILFRKNKIKNIRIYDADESFESLQSGSGIEISVCLPNELLIDVSKNGSIALKWIQVNLEPFLPGTSICGIAVGNEILGGDIAISEALVPAVKSVYRALRRLGLADTIEVSTPHSEASFNNTYPPSDGAFKTNFTNFDLITHTGLRLEGLK